MDCSEENILFNSLKHHVQAQLKTVEESDADNFYCLLLKTGGSIMDVYHGYLSVNELESEAIRELTRYKIVTRDLYISVLEKRQGYFQLPFSDGSKWVFRLGNDPDKYIHIHPARNSVFTKRIKASTLKTLLALLFENVPTDLENINRLREEKLQLSPIKSLEQSKTILAALNWYRNL